jgi:hypothetical protein
MMACENVEHDTALNPMVVAGFNLAITLSSVAGEPGPQQQMVGQLFKKS